MPGLEEYLRGIEEHHFGGTCYALNSHLNDPLLHLGYDARLCGADMSAPDVHVANIVSVEGREFIVDVGYAAPFVAPLPRDRATDFEILHGADRYVLKPQDEAGNSLMELHRDGVLSHRYLLKPASRAIGEFASVVAESYAPDATFMNAILLARYGTDASVVIRNLDLIRTARGVSSRRRLAGKEELVDAVHREFRIEPKIVEAAVAGLMPGLDAWG